MRTDAELVVLDQSADSLAAALIEFDQRLLRRGRHNKLHDDFAFRAQHLGQHLRGVLALVKHRAYPSAFALLRTCMEHHFIDHLACLGRRYVTVLQNVPQEDFESMLVDYESGAEHAQDVHEAPTRSRKGHVRLVREGHHVRDSDGATAYTISPVHVVLERDRPFVGRPSDQELLDDGILNLDAQVEEARRQRDLWTHNLSWSSVTASLATNEFYTETEMRQWDVHYRFLSAFVHAGTAGYEQVHPRLDPPEIGASDHYAHELAMLYANALGARELDVLRAMSRNPPEVALSDLDGLTAIGQHARNLSSVLWLPGDDPHAYDHRNISDRRIWIEYRRRQDLAEARRVVADRDDGEDIAVLYYSNPLERLVGMHESSTEMTTGNTYVSPWERSDARRR